MKLFSMPSSGNSYKARLVFALLGMSYEHVPCEHLSPALSAAKQAGHLPLGKVPALHLDDGRILTESNAIIWFLAQGSALIPDDTFAQAEMLGWMFFEQNRHEPVIALRAGLRIYPDRIGTASDKRMRVLLDEGHALLQLMEDALENRDWLVGDAVTLADIALYAYTHTAGERGGFDMTRFPNTNKWCHAVAQLPNYVSLTDYA